ncbi:MAG: hypothetical protein ABI158_07595 [Edaphobacter sp.]
MNCQQIQEHILGSFDESLDESFDEARWDEQEFDLHIATCADCAEFLAMQKSIDAELSSALAPPQLSSSFRPNIHRLMGKTHTHAWFESLPEIVQVSSCTIATLVCVPLLPFSAFSVLGSGAVITAIIYVLQTSIRAMLEDVDDTTAYG